MADSERAGVYLTNSLTGWEAPKGPEVHLPIPELEEERDAAEHVKRKAPILVIMGNPPYNAFAGVAESGEGEELVKVYKEGLIEKWGIKKFNLDDLYVRFFRMAEKRIVDKSGRGIVCFISSYSYLSDPSYVVMREHLTEGFDKLWFDCMNGDSRETGKTTPEGLPDPSVFSTSTNREGIRVGTTIGLMVRKPKRLEKKELFFRQFWGINKRTDLLRTLHNSDSIAPYQQVNSSVDNRYSFRTCKITAQYLKWPKVTELCLEYSNGLMEKRGGALMDMQKDDLEKRLRAYFDSKLTWDEYKILGYGLTEDAASFDAIMTRKKILRADDYDSNKLIPYLLRPFDKRWCYYSQIPSLWNRPRPSLYSQYWTGNDFFITRFNGSKDNEGAPFYWSSFLCDDHCLSPDASAFPLRLKKEITQRDMFSIEPSIIANLSDPARAYLANLRIDNPNDSNSIEQGINPYELIWYHALAIGYSQAYLSENKDGIQDDWPRIPLPADRSTLIDSALLGKQIAALLNTGGNFPNSLSSSEISSIATLRKTDGNQINPQQGDLALTAGWGHRQGKIVMPGRGKFADYGHSLDIYLNDKVFWQNIPIPVWEYVIGGYQVIKKWLSYREKDVLGRDMSVEEIREVTNMARRIAALVNIQKELDENYERVKKIAIPLS